MSEPYTRLVIIGMHADGTFDHAAIHQSQVLAGKLYDLDPRAIYAGDEASLAPYLGQLGAAAISALSARDATISASGQQITSLTAERDAAKARVAELEAKIAAAAEGSVDENGVPVRVPMAAGRIALSRAGKLASVKAALAAISGQPGEEAREWFGYSSHIERRHPTVLAMTQLIGTSADVDALFIAAAEIDALTRAAAATA